MRKNNSHVSKTKPERDYYSKYIKSQDYEPTIDETLKFPSTDDDKKDFSNSRTRKKRKPTFQQQLSDHWHENWPKWIGGGIVAILFWLMFDSKIEINSINYNVNDIKEDIQDMKKVDKETNEHLQNQDLNIRENQIRIENIQKSNKK